MMPYADVWQWSRSYVFIQLVSICVGGIQFCLFCTNCMTRSIACSSGCFFDENNKIRLWVMNSNIKLYRQLKWCEDYSSVDVSDNLTVKTGTRDSLCCALNVDWMTCNYYHNARYEQC
jgi:hypothetical protein